MASFDAPGGAAKAAILRLDELSATGLVWASWGGKLASVGAQGILAAIPLPAAAGRLGYEPSAPRHIDWQEPISVDYQPSINSLTLTWTDEAGALLPIGEHVVRLCFISRYS